MHSYPSRRCHNRNEPILFRFLRMQGGTPNDVGGRESDRPPGKVFRGRGASHSTRVDCFGFVFRLSLYAHWGLVSDTRMHESLAHRFRECELLVVNVTFEKPSLDRPSFNLRRRVSPRRTSPTHAGAHAPWEEDYPRPTRGR